MDYEKSTPFTGDPAQVLRSLVLTFSHLGFRVERKEARQVELSGPGMHSSRESALMGVSRLVLEIDDGVLRAQAEFGSVRRLLKWAGYFIAGLGLFLVILFAFLFRDRPEFKLWTVILPFAPWPLLLPVLHRVLLARTRRALDNLLHNAALVADQ